jgi:hypothetical protein
MSDDVKATETAKDEVLSEKALRYHEIGYAIDGHRGCLMRLADEKRVADSIDGMVRHLGCLVTAKCFGWSDDSLDRVELSRRVDPFVRQIVADYIAARKAFLANLESMLPGVTVVERDDDTVGRVVAVVPQGQSKLSKDQ